MAHCIHKSMLAFSCKWTPHFKIQPSHLYNTKGTRTIRYAISQRLVTSTNITTIYSVTTIIATIYSVTNKGKSSCHFSKFSYLHHAISQRLATSAIIATLYLLPTDKTTHYSSSTPRTNVPLPYPSYFQILNG